MISVESDAKLVYSLDDFDEQAGDPERPLAQLLEQTSACYQDSRAIFWPHALELFHEFQEQWVACRARYGAPAHVVARPTEEQLYNHLQTNYPKTWPLYIRTPLTPETFAPRA